MDNLQNGERAVQREGDGWTHPRADRWTAETHEERDAAADRIMAELQEAPGRSEAWWTVSVLLRWVGLAEVKQLVLDAKQLEGIGGMLTEDETRRRTVGGIFFKLAKMNLGTRTWVKGIAPTAAADWAGYWAPRLRKDRAKTVEALRAALVKFGQQHQSEHAFELLRAALGIPKALPPKPAPQAPPPCTPKPPTVHQLKPKRTVWDPRDPLGPRDPKPEQPYTRSIKFKGERTKEVVPEVYVRRRPTTETSR